MIFQKGTHARFFYFDLIRALKWSYLARQTLAYCVDSKSVVLHPMKSLVSSKKVRVRPRVSNYDQGSGARAELGISGKLVHLLEPTRKI